MTEIRTKSGGLPEIFGAGSFAFQGRKSVNGSRLDEIAFNWDAANLVRVPFARENTGMAGGTRVSTTDGLVRIDELSPGDRVLNAHGTPVQVHHILRTPVTKRAVMIRAPYFGLDQDLILGRDHRITITSEAAEYLFGCETILVPAWAINDGRRAGHWDLGSKTELFQLQLDQAGALKIGTCGVESMPKSGQSIGKILSDAEARCFATEYRNGIYS